MKPLIHVHASILKYSMISLRTEIISRHIPHASIFCLLYHIYIYIFFFMYMSDIKDSMVPKPKIDILIRLGCEHQSTGGPEDWRTRGPEDQRTIGAEDWSTRGPEYWSTGVPE